MHVERITRGVAGIMIILSLALSQFHSAWWLLLTAFVGLNMLQSAFTNTCPLMAILRRAKIPSAE
ncbi:YgaP family membrane protein [Desulfovibrio ferrophilus]|uniref:Inner membrane protein YgaP-like transmembrane domain-containing protein n=1 Tax=Desulfovibrio ferrophilus TaxID=241368 RepID=A0A2Z6B2Z3_9BACT|nr:DUF2892 domain-containing protein [Desulfovibrio ferrophilus]BBD09862.1 conserved exported protein of unknown function [Desulfovibrio ferrophilus]